MTTRKYAASKGLTPDWYLTQKGDQLTTSERKSIVEQTRKAVHRFGPRLRIVNLGVGPGATIHCLRAGAPGAKIYCVEAAPGRLHPQGEQVLGDIELILGWTQERETQDKVQSPVHVLLVDGSHKNKSVRGDIQGWMPKLPVGGRVWFHDYDKIPARILVRYPEMVGVKQAVDEWRRSPGWGRAWREVGRVDKAIAFERIGRDC